MSKGKLRYATANHPTIEGVIYSLYRFFNEQQALDRMNTIREHFIISKEQIDNEYPSIVLWIHGFDISPEEEAKGYMGNYAVISYHKVDDRYTLYAQKIERPLKNHPQRKRQRSKHPNWGHPVLREIKKQKVYTDVEEPRALLMQLHEEYPDVTIPCANKIYTIIYTRTKNPPIQKYRFDIMVHPEGGFVIKYEENTYQAPPGKEPKFKASQEQVVAADAVAKEQPEPTGYFTSKEMLKRK